MPFLDIEAILLP